MTQPPRLRYKIRTLGRRLPDLNFQESDHFWGYDIHTCQGQNTLGKLLEAYRATIMECRRTPTSLPRETGNRGVVQMLSTEGTSSRYQ